ncbi:hypothetical protein M1446_00455 [Candidatus Dependentiae bacterium]|nr:hypothetical protein [Candidatus Dependentiae bacterium]
MKQKFLFSCYLKYIQIMKITWRPVRRSFSVAGSLGLLFFQLLSATDNANYIKSGNLALPASQMPGPLFSFGQNIVDKNDLLGFFYVSHEKGKNLTVNDVFVSLLYGITENCSIFFNVPITNPRQNPQLNDVQDLNAQIEYAFYNKSNFTALNQATIVAHIALPKDRISINSKGFLNPSFFIGLTYSHLAIDWYYFISPGATFNTLKKNTGLGNEFFYQFGLGRNIGNPGGWILTWIIEFDGTYRQRDKINGKINPNSGHNVIALGPVLWLSSQRISIEFGAQFPILQQIFGNQPKSSYLIELDINWKF